MSFTQLLLAVGTILEHELEQHIVTCELLSCNEIQQHQLVHRGMKTIKTSQDALHTIADNQRRASHIQNLGYDAMNVVDDCNLS